MTLYLVIIWEDDKPTVLCDYDNFDEAWEMKCECDCEGNFAIVETVKIGIEK